MTFETEITIPVTVEYEYHRAWRARRDVYGRPEVPDEPEEFDITAIRIEGGAGIDFDALPGSVQSGLLEECEDDFKS
jgi:hypothetical protein